MSIHCDIRGADFGAWLTELDSEGNEMPGTKVEYPTPNEQDMRRFYEVFGDDVYEYDDHLIGVKPLKEVDEDGDALVLLGVDGEIEKVKLDTFIESLSNEDAHGVEFGSRPYGKRNVLSIFSWVLGRDRNVATDLTKKGVFLLGIMATFLYFLTEIEAAHKGAQLYKQSLSTVDLLKRSHIDESIYTKRRALLKALNQSTYLSRDDIKYLNRSRQETITEDGDSYEVRNVKVPSDNITAKLKNVHYYDNYKTVVSDGQSHDILQVFLVTKPLISETLEYIEGYTTPQVLKLVNSWGRDVWFKYELGLVKLGIQQEIWLIEAMEKAGFSDETIVNASKVAAENRTYLALAARLLGAFTAARLVSEAPSALLRLKSATGQLDKDSVYQRLENHIHYDKGLKKKGKNDGAKVALLLRDLQEIVGKTGERSIRYTGTLDQKLAELRRVYDNIRQLGDTANWDEKHPPPAMSNMKLE